MFIILSTLESCDLPVEWRKHHQDTRVNAIVVLLPHTAPQTAFNEIGGESVGTVTAFSVCLVRVPLKEQLVIHSHVVSLDVICNLCHVAGRLLTGLTHP